MGVFAGLGVSVGVQDTLPRNRGDLDSITDSITGWTHTSGAIGGYMSATCNLTGDLNYIDEWLEQGLGRWLTLYDEGGNIGWRGYVDQIDANIGALRITRGPLTQLANRTNNIYSTVDASTTPPTMGIRAVTPTLNDTASQAIYGIWRRTLSCGGATAADAVQMQTLYLREHNQPETTKTLTLGGGGTSMTLQLKGAWNWLNYNANFTTAGTVNLSDRIIAILALDPNVLISTDTSHIAPNTYQVPGYYNEYQIASKYITSLLTFGDVAYSRYTFGFYGPEVPYYAAVPTALEYTYSLADTAQEVTSLSGVTIRPWEVQPARWLQVSDLMIGRVPDTDLKDDPRNIFIESLTYTAPYGLTLNGAKVGTLAQKLAQLGLGGVGG